MIKVLILFIVMSTAIICGGISEIRAQNKKFEQWKKEHDKARTAAHDAMWATWATEHGYSDIAKAIKA